jgi:O-antigen/teichoic acid export membrane protein
MDSETKPVSVARSAAEQLVDRVLDGEIGPATSLLAETPSVPGHLAGGVGDAANEPPQVDEHELHRKVRGGLGWSILNNVIGRLGTFISGVAMARLLNVSDFGTFAAALAVMQIFLGLNDVGLSAALIRWPGPIQRVAGTVMSLVVLSSLAFFGLYAALVPAFASLLHVPGATTLLLVLGITLISDGIFATHSAVLTREFLQGRRTAVDMLNLVVTTTVSIGCAIAGLGPWSLVWGRLAGNLAAGGLIVALTPMRIRPQWRRELLAPLLRFGAPLAGSGLLVLGMLNMDYLVVGRILGNVQLGYYLMAFNLASWPVSMFAFAVARVSLAGFAQLAHDRVRLQEGYATALRMLLAVALPACVGLSVLAGPIMRTLYGNRWAPAAPALALLAIMSAGRVVIEFSYDLFIAVGRPRMVFGLQGLWTVTLLPALIVGAQLDGIRGAAWARALITVGLVVPALFAMLARSGIDIRLVLMRSTRPVLASLAMVPVLLLTLLLPSDPVRLAAGVGLGALIYLAIGKPMLVEARALLRGRGEQASSDIDSRGNPAVNTDEQGAVIDEATPLEKADATAPSGSATADERHASRWLPLALGMGLILLSLAWAGGNPPLATPDEPENFVKTVATGRMSFTGDAYAGNTSSLPKVSADYYHLVGRSYSIPGKLAYSGDSVCYAFYPDRTASCQPDPHTVLESGAVTKSTEQGSYEPFLYVLPGLSTLGADNFYQAQLRARITNSVFAGGFMLWAALLLYRRRRDLLVLAGLAVGVTPMVLFLSASAATNGTETALGVCTWAALLALSRPEDGHRRNAWIALGVSGSLLALARMLDPVYIVVALAVIAVLIGSRSVRARIRDGGRTAVASLGAIAIASLVTVYWDLTVLPSPPFSLSTAVHALPSAVKGLPNQVRQLVGIFGWNDTTMPQLGYAFWLLLALVVVVPALRWGTGRQRLALLGLVVAIVLGDIGIATVIEAQIGFTTQARYLLPLIVGIPMLAAEIAARRWPASRVRRWSAPTLIGGAALLHLGAWLANEHRYAVGRSGGWLLPWSTAWRPIGGWAPWATLAVVGAGLVAAPVFAELRKRPVRTAQLPD